MKILTICIDYIPCLQFLKSCARLHDLCIEIAMPPLYILIAYELSNREKNVFYSVIAERFRLN